MNIEYHHGQMWKFAETLIQNKLGVKKLINERRLPLFGVLINFNYDLRKTHGYSEELNYLKNTKFLGNNFWIYSGRIELERRDDFISSIKSPWSKKAIHPIINSLPYYKIGLDYSELLEKLKETDLKNIESIIKTPFDVQEVFSNPLPGSIKLGINSYILQINPLYEKIFIEKK